jgi:hypothetical protein
MKEKERERERDRERERERETEMYVCLGLGGHSVDTADADSAQELGGGRHVEVEGVLGLAGA